ncbi:MAG: aldehyde dehydrogenase (NAD+), partial [Akkermansiaceae bacterium]
MVEIVNLMAWRGEWPLEARLEALGKLEEGVKRRREEVLAALAEDLGKPDIEAFLAEYWFVLQEIRLVRKKLKRWLKPRKVGSPLWFWPCRSRVELEAFGRVLLIAPWNYPVQLALAPLISAVAAGNSVVLKPSEMAPASAQLLEDLLTDCFPSEQVTVVQGGKEVAEELLEADFDFIFFTGSTEVGRSVAEKAARTLTPTVLELGGKCPCVVDSTVDLEIAAKRILIGKFFNGGQTCFAPDFVAVEESIRDKLVAAMERFLRELPWEDEMSRIVNRRHYDRVLGLVSGREICKGEDDVKALKIAPRILPDADWRDPAMSEEIFGPVLPVVGFRDSAQLISNLRDY